MATLRALQSAANRQGVTAPQSWATINNNLRGTGSPYISFEEFEQRWFAEDETGILHQLVSDYDEDGLTIKTSSQSPLQSMPQEPDQGTGQMAQMAKRATQKAFK